MPFYTCAPGHLYNDALFLLQGDLPMVLLLWGKDFSSMEDTLIRVRGRIFQKVVALLYNE